VANSEKVTSALDRCVELHAIATHLSELALALETVGNTHLADELFAASANIKRNAECIRRDIHGMTTERFEEARSEVGALLSKLVDKAFDDQ